MLSETRLSFSMLTNYLQCPFRLALLASKPDTLLFKPQFVGLFVHEWIERYIRQKVNGEGVTMDYGDIVRSVLREDRVPVFPIEEAVSEIDENMLHIWGEELLSYLQSRGVYHVQTEFRVEKQQGGFLFTGIVDIIAHTPAGCFIIDLKRSNSIQSYDAKQLTMYAWLLEEMKVKEGCLFFMKDRGTPPFTEVVSFDFKAEEKLLRWIISELKKIGHILDCGLYEYLPPKPFSRTCHPNRCSVYYMCPHGGLIYEHNSGEEIWFMEEQQEYEEKYEEKHEEKYEEKYEEKHEEETEEWVF